MGKILSAYLMPHPPIIIKEIGKGEEKKLRATIESMEYIAEDVRQKRPDTIIVIIITMMVSGLFCLTSSAIYSIDSMVALNFFSSPLPISLIIIGG